MTHERIRGVTVVKLRKESQVIGLDVCLPRMQGETAFYSLVVFFSKGPDIRLLTPDMTQHDLSKGAAALPARAGNLRQSTPHGEFFIS